jgi:cytochrome d ubiquinol oxidase subunit II
MDMTSLPIPFDFWTLRLVWWFVLGLLVAGYCITQGFDLGVSIMIPFVAKNDDEKRVLMNTVGPFWEGSQIWLVLGGGAAFAAWPYLYAVAFSGLYSVVFLALFTIIMRPVSFKFRSKLSNITWRAVWDMGIFIGALVPTLLLGVGIGNFLQNGFSFSFDDHLRLSFDGKFMDLLTPYSLLWGAFITLLFVRHGAGFLMFKTDGTFSKRLKSITQISNGVSLILGIYLLAQCFNFGFQYQQNLDITHVGPSNPLLKPETLVILNTWYENLFQKGGLGHIKILWICPTLLALGFIGVHIAAKYSHKVGVFLSSSINLLGLVATFGWLTFPILLPSKHLRHTLTVYDASSSQLTLFVMLIAVIIFLPLVLAYTTWVYRVMRGQITVDDIKQNEKELY